MSQENENQSVATQEMPAHEQDALFDKHLGGIAVAGGNEPEESVERVTDEPDQAFVPDQPAETEAATEPDTGEFDPDATVELTQQELLNLLELGIIPGNGGAEEPTAEPTDDSAPTSEAADAAEPEAKADPFYQDFDLESLPAVEITDDQYDKIMSDKSEMAKFYTEQRKQAAALGAQIAIREIAPYVQQMAVTAASNRLIEMEWRQKHPEFNGVSDDYFKAATAKVYKDVGVEKLKSMHPHDILDLAAKKLQGLTRLKNGLQRAGGRVNVRPNGVKSPVGSGGARQGNTGGAPAKATGIAAIHEMMKQSAQG